MLADFTRFLKEYGVIGLAIAVIIGTAAKDLVNAVVDDVIMPLVGIVLPGGDWRAATAMVGSAEIRYGHLLGASLDFLIIALLVYAFYRYAMQEDEIKKIS